MTTIEKARELGVALANSPEFLRLTEARERMDANTAVTKLLQEYHMKEHLIVSLMEQDEVSQESAGDAFDFLDPQAKASVLCSYKSAGILSADEVRTSLKYPARGGMADELTSANVANQGTLGDSPNNEGGKGNKGGKD